MRKPSVKSDLSNSMWWIVQTPKTSKIQGNKGRQIVYAQRKSMTPVADRKLWFHTLWQLLSQILTNCSTTFFNTGTLSNQAMSECYTRIFGQIQSKERLAYPRVSSKDWLQLHLRYFLSSTSRYLMAIRLVVSTESLKWNSTLSV